MKPYIEFNNNERQQANNEFDDGYWKLMNNIIFENMCETTINRIVRMLTSYHDKAVKLFSKLHAKWSEYLDGSRMFEMF